MPPKLSLQGVTVSFGGPPLFTEVDLHVGAGDRIALVGRNGTGKSTLLQVLAGRLMPDSGRRVVQPGARVVYLPQIPELAGFSTARDAVQAALPPELSGEPWRVDAALADVGLPPECAVATLSGGESRRVALARMFVAAPDIVLLDEPTNHLDLPTIEWLERALGELRAGLVVVSHDRAFLGQLSRTTLWLERGRLHRTERGFREFEAWSEQLVAEEELQAAKLTKRIAEETRWSREGISARRKRNQGRLRRLHALRAERAERRSAPGSAKLVVETGNTSGRLVIETEGVHKTYGDRAIVRDLSLTVLRGDRVGIIGPNGAGKTTLLRLLTGELDPDRGTVRLGTQLTPVYIDQNRDRLDLDQTLQAALCEPGTDRVMVRGELRHVASYLRDFLFDGRDARRAIGSLSGGERARLLLAMDLKKPANLLILDEPTNDLDLETLDLLEEVLADFDGTLLLVSHDRDFLDRLATSTLAYEGDGRWVEYAGGYSDFLIQRRSAGAPAPSGRAKPADAQLAEPLPKRAPKKRLTWQEQRAYESLPGEIASFEAEILELEGRLGDGEWYVSDRPAFEAAAARLEAARDALAAAEERWLELEMERESLEG